MIEIHWRYHDSSETRVRVWRNDWASDQFELITLEQFNEMERIFKRFSIPVVEQED